MNNIVRNELAFGWRRMAISNVCRIVSGSTPDSGIEGYWNGDIIWITPTDLGKLEGYEITSSGRRITRAGYESCATEMVPAGSVILSSRAPIGHLGIARIPICINQGCKAFVPGEDVDALFLYYTLKYLMPGIREMGSGATFAEVSKSQLERFTVSLPPLSQQKRIAAILNEQMQEVERARVAIQAQLEAASRLFFKQLRAMFESHEARKWPAKQLVKSSL